MFARGRGQFRSSLPPPLSADFAPRSANATSPDRTPPIDARAPWLVRVVHGLAADARFARRTLAKERSFTATALLTLALCIGTNTAIFEVKPGDPLAYVAVSLLLLAVALPASYLPARRAARIDPLIALRVE